ncbi:MAG: sensor histidine kinase [Saprospiraceae bacterium]
MDLKFTKKSILSTILFGFLVGSLLMLEELAEGELELGEAVGEIAMFLLILSIAFVTIVLPFRRLIHVLNQRMSWGTHFIQRFAIQTAAVVGSAAILGVVFGNLIYLMEDDLPVDALIVRMILYLLITFSIIMALLELQQLNDEKEALERLSQRLEKEKIETLYNSLKQQVNPHFLFNSLSVLSSLVHYDPEKAEQFIEHFADIYRYVLDINKKHLVTLEEELHFLESYLFLQSIRFGDNIKLEKSITEQHKLHKIPPLTLQLVFENILKHNVISRKQPMQVEMKIENDFLTIENTLRPRQAAHSTQIGTNNLQEKYRLLGGVLPSFEEKAATYAVKLPLLSAA